MYVCIFCNVSCLLLSFTHHGMLNSMVMTLEVLGLVSLSHTISMAFYKHVRYAFSTFLSHVVMKKESSGPLKA